MRLDLFCKQISLALIIFEKWEGVVGRNSVLMENYNLLFCMFTTFELFSSLCKLDFVFQYILSEIRNQGFWFFSLTLLTWHHWEPKPGYLGCSKDPAAGAGCSHSLLWETTMTLSLMCILLAEMLTQQNRELVGLLLLILTPPLKDVWSPTSRNQDWLLRHFLVCSLV